MKSQVEAIISNVYDDEQYSVSLVEEMVTYFDNWALHGIILALNLYSNKEIVNFLRSASWDFDEVWTKEVFSQILTLKDQDLENKTNTSFPYLWSILSKNEQLKEEYQTAILKMSPLVPFYANELFKIDPDSGLKLAREVYNDCEHFSPRSLDEVYVELRRQKAHSQIMAYFYAPKKEWVLTSHDLISTIKQGEEVFRQKFEGSYIPDTLTTIISRAGEKRSIQNELFTFLEKDHDWYLNAFLKNAFLDYTGFIKVLSHFDKVSDYSETELQLKKWSEKDFQRALEIKNLNEDLRDKLEMCLDDTNYFFFKNKVIRYQIISGLDYPVFPVSSTLNQIGLALMILLFKKEGYDFHTELRTKVCLNLNLIHPTITSLQYKQIQKVIARLQDREPYKKSVIAALENKQTQLRVNLMNNPQTKLQGIFK